jgi:hypothetical protein
MNKVYCTYFDNNYLLQGVTMIESLRKCGDFSTVYILALDDAVSKTALIVNSVPKLNPCDQILMSTILIIIDR